MKKLFTSMLCVFIAIPLLLTVWGFALPAQYSNTFVGELPAKRALLTAESDKPRLILVGGSAAASALTALCWPGSCLTISPLILACTQHSAHGSCWICP